VIWNASVTQSVAIRMTMERPTPSAGLSRNIQKVTPESRIAKTSFIQRLSKLHLFNLRTPPDHLQYITS
jgi:hypothetical protein